MGKSKRRARACLYFMPQEIGEDRRIAMTSFGFNKSPEAFLAAQESSEIERRLYDCIVPQNKARAIDPKTFENHYGKESVAKDMKFVAEREEQFHRQGEESNMDAAGFRRGELFEAIVNNGIEGYHWLGKDAKVIVPSRFDDIKNGIDSIVVLKIKLGHATLALSVDMTKDATAMRGKIAKIKSSIDRGELSMIKYFAFGGFRGERSVPRTIVGADQNTIHNVAELLLRAKKMAQNKVSKESDVWKEVDQLLRNHPFQFQMLDEIRIQLNAFQTYAESIGQTELADRYAEALDIVMHIAEEKERVRQPSSLRNQGEKGESDAVYQSLTNEMKRFGK